MQNLSLDAMLPSQHTSMLLQGFVGQLRDEDDCHGTHGEDDQNGLPQVAERRVGNVHQSQHDDEQHGCSREVLRHDKGADEEDA